VDTRKINITLATVKAVATQYVVAAVDYVRGLSRQTRHTVLGGAVVMAGAIALVLSQGASEPKTGGGYELNARFGSVDGVGKGTKVLLAGIEVGEVVRRAYEPGRQRALLVLSMRRDIEIPLDTVAMIVSDGLMGNKYIKLQPGGETEMLRDGGTFEYVQDSIIFEEILEKVILNAEQKRKKEQGEDKEKKTKPDRDAVRLKDAPTATALLPRAYAGRRMP